MADFGISEAQIIGLFLESVFWGILLITFFQCIRHLLWDAKGSPKKVSNIHWPMLAVSVSLFSFSTLDVALGLMHNVEAFIFYTGPGGSDARFTGITDWVNVMKTVDVVLGKSISDGVLVYRCWVIFSKNWSIILFPIVLWCGSFACTILMIYLEASGSKHPNILLTSGGSGSLHPSIVAGWAISITLNILTTGLIVWRIYTVDQESAQFAVGTEGSRVSRHLFGRKRSRLQNVIRIIVESGLMYTTIAFIGFVTYVVNNNSFYATTDVELQILSIAFNLIIIRMSTRPEDDYTLTSTKSSGTAMIFPLRNLRGRSNKMTQDSHPIEVDVVVSSEQDIDYGHGDHSRIKYITKSLEHEGEDNV